MIVGGAHMAETWDGTQALKLVRDVARQQITRFANFPDVDREELASRLLQHVVKAWPSFDPRRGSFSTWVTVVASRRTISELRNCIARKRNEEAYRQAKVGDVVSVQDPAGSPMPTRVRMTGDEEIVGEDFKGEYAWLDPEPETPETFEGEIVGDDRLPLTQWLTRTYDAASRFADGPQFRERRTYPAAQLITVKALAKRLNLSIRGARGLFLDRPDLCRIVGFPPVPGHNWFQHALGADRTFLARHFSRPPAA